MGNRRGVAARIRAVGSWLTSASRAPEPPVRSTTWPRPDVRACAAECRDLIAAGGSEYDCFRAGLLALRDYYEQTLAQRGPVEAAALFTDPPEPTGSIGLDHAFADLADCFARRDGWTAPAWSSIGPEAGPKPGGIDPG